MSLNNPSPVFALVLLCASSTFAQIETPEQFKNNFPGVDHEPLGTWWERHYVRNLGLTPFHTDIVGIAKPASDAKYETLVASTGLEGSSAVNVESSEKDFYYPLSDFIPAKRGSDGIYPLNHTLLILRLQNDLISKPADAQPGTFVWQDDQEAGEQSSWLDMALLADIYFAGPGPFGYTPKAQFHLVLGAELEKFSTGNQATDIEMHRYSVLAEFSPGAVLGLQMSSPDKPRQLMALGWVFENDLVADVAKHSFQIRYLPVLDLFNKSFWIGERSYFHKWFKFFNAADFQAHPELYKFASGAETDKVDQTAPVAEQLQSIENISDYHHLYFRPQLALDFGDTSAPTAILDGTSNINFLYGLDMGLSFYEETFNFGYKMNGIVGLDGGDSHLTHEIYAHVSPRGWPGRMFVSYRRGDFAPSFRDVDVLQIGFGIKL